MTLVAERPASGEQQKPPTVPPPTQAEFERAIKAARKDWQNNEIVTTKDMQRAYGDAVQAYKQNVMSGKMGPVTRARRNELLDDLERHTAALNDTSLFALRNGVSRSYATGVNTAQPHLEWLEQVQKDLLPGTGDQVAVRTLAQGYAERELVSYLARTNASGLTLSDAVWGASDPFKKGITGLVEEAVVTGMSARDLAKQIDALDPTRPIRPSSQAVIDDLNLKYKGIGQDISWEAVRLARTEVNTAGREGTVVGHSVSPVLEGFKWHRSGRVYDCKICDGLSKGIVRGVQVGTSQGVYMPEDVPVGHPNCRCYLTPEVPTREETMQQLEEWRADPASQPAIEDWYSKLTGAEPTIGAPPPIPGGVPPAPPTPTAFTVPPWKEAKTVKEANAYAESLPGVQRSSYKRRADLPMANIVNHDLAELAEQGFDLPDEIVVQDVYKKSPGAIAAYQGPGHWTVKPGSYGSTWSPQETDKMYLFSKHPYWQDPVNRARNKGPMAEGGDNWFTSSSPNHVVRHEMGHKAHHDVDPKAFDDMGRGWGWFTNVPEEITKFETEVSGYGATGPLEFVAEMYAGALDGKTYSEDMVRIYDYLVGAPLPSPIPRS